MIYPEMLDTDLALTNCYIRRIDGPERVYNNEGAFIQRDFSTSLGRPFLALLLDKKGRGGDVGLK